MFLALSRAFAFLSLPFVLLATTGCATILGGGGNKTIEVSSVPSGQSVEIRNKSGNVVHTGVTPFTVTVPRGKGWFNPERYTFKVSPAGYEQVVPSELNMWYFGNLVFGGLIGMVIVDPLTGAMFDFPSRLKLSATPEK